MIDYLVESSFYLVRVFVYPFNPVFSLVDIKQKHFICQLIIDAFVRIQNSEYRSQESSVAGRLWEPRPKTGAKYARRRGDGFGDFILKNCDFLLTWKKISGKSYVRIQETEYRIQKF